MFIKVFCALLFPRSSVYHKSTQNPVNLAEASVEDREQRAQTQPLLALTRTGKGVSLTEHRTLMPSTAQCQKHTPTTCNMHSRAQTMARTYIQYRAHACLIVGQGQLRTKPTSGWGHLSSSSRLVGEVGLEVSWAPHMWMDFRRSGRKS